MLFTHFNSANSDSFEIFIATFIGPISAQDSQLTTGAFKTGMSILADTRTLQPISRSNTGCQSTFSMLINNNNNKYGFITEGMSSLKEKIDNKRDLSDLVLMACGD